MLEQIITGLQQDGWKIENSNVDWIIAHKGQKGVLITSLTHGQVLNPFGISSREEQSVSHWEAIIFCPEGLSSYDLRQPTLKKIQSWYIDLQTGSVFPYPPSEKKQTLNQVLSYLASPSTTEILSDTSNESTEHPSKTLHESPYNIPYITLSLIGINLIIFILMALMNGFGIRDIFNPFSQKILIYFGAKVNNLILQGELWRFITSMFLHLNFLHITFNLYALWTIGPIIEQLKGRLRYLAVYFLSGISGSIASFFFTDALSAGASGAIFGLLGALVTTTLKNKALWKSGLGKNLILVIIINLSLGFLIPNIDIYAHLGGLICGLILGRLFP